MRDSMGFFGIFSWNNQYETNQVQLWNLFLTKEGNIVPQLHEFSQVLVMNEHFQENSLDSQLIHGWQFYFMKKH